MVSVLDSQYCLCIAVPQSNNVGIEIPEPMRFLMLLVHIFGDSINEWRLIASSMTPSKNKLFMLLSRINLTIYKFAIFLIGIITKVFRSILIALGLNTDLSSRFEWFSSHDRVWSEVTRGALSLKYLIS
jgi:hypothetical protein